MDIRLRYFDGCPGWELALERLREALRETGHGQEEVVLERLESPEQAEALGFTGSPTILIDGADPFAEAAAPVGLTCRVYGSEHGFEPAPSPGQIREALRARG